MGKKKKERTGEIRRYLMWTRWKRSFTSRAISLMITTGVGFVLTGDLRAGLALGLADTVVKIGVYYGHEWLWERKIRRDIKKIKRKYKDYERQDDTRTQGTKIS